MIRDIAAQNKSLDNDYGATHGPNAPASHLLALFVGDPCDADNPGTELTSAGGYARKTLPNDGTVWDAAASGVKTSKTITFATAAQVTGEWSDVPTHWGLLDAADGSTMWDSQALAQELVVTTDGSAVYVTLSIFFDPNEGAN